MAPLAAVFAANGAPKLGAYPSFIDSFLTPGPFWHGVCDASGMNADHPPALPDVDTRVRFVKLIEERADGLVAFEFAIGWPELAVELLLPAPAFAEFCAANRVQRLDA